MMWVIRGCREAEYERLFGRTMRQKRKSIAVQLIWVLSCEQGGDKL